MAVGFARAKVWASMVHPARLETPSPSQRRSGPRHPLARLCCAGSHRKLIPAGFIYQYPHRGRVWGQTGFPKEGLDWWAHLMGGDDSFQNNLKRYAQGCRRRMWQRWGGSPDHCGPSLTQDPFPAASMSCSLLPTAVLHVLRPARLWGLEFPDSRDFDFAALTPTEVSFASPSPSSPPDFVCLWFCTGKKRNNRRFPGDRTPCRPWESRQ